MSLKNILKSLISLMMSFFFIWIVGYFFKDSLPSWSYSPVLEKYTYHPDTDYFERSEGYGETYYGQYGINGYKDISANNSHKIVIWGDSFVEAHQVDDVDKIWSVLNGFFVKDTFDDFIAVSIGTSGDSVADYAANIPKYNKIINNVTTHFIVLTDFRDTLPDQPTSSERTVFRSSPFRIEKMDWQPSQQNIKRILNKMGLYFIWEPIRKLSQFRVNFFTKKENIEKRKSINDYSTPEECLDAWNFLFNHLKKISPNIPIVFVYCPTIPVVNNGQIEFTDEYDNLKKSFIKDANDNAFEVIDLTDSFIANYMETGTFPRGFQNTKPSVGHFNKTGDSLVAQAIFKFIKSKPEKYAIYKH